MRRSRSWIIASGFVIRGTSVCFGDEDRRGNESMEQERIIVVKYGGSAITRKKQYETINDVALQTTVDQLTRIVNNKSSPSFVIVHGAGSFGHFQAHKYGLRSGGGETWKIGLSKTRESVLKLNSIILQAHCNNDLPCVSVSLFPTVTMNKNDIELFGSLKSIPKLMEAGFIPITHGDVLIDKSRQCVVFSGDRILEWLIKEISTTKQDKQILAVFLTDVQGLYDRAPDDIECDSPPRLISQIYVTLDGKILTPLDLKASTTTLSHDVTGGITSKITTALKIVQETGIEIFLVQAGTPHAARALSGDIAGESDTACRNRENWVGTRISLWKGGF